MSENSSQVLCTSNTVIFEYSDLLSLCDKQKTKPSEYELVDDSQLLVRGSKTIFATVCGCKLDIVE